MRKATVIARTALLHHVPKTYLQKKLNSSSKQYFNTIDSDESNTRSGSSGMGIFSSEINLKFKEPLSRYGSVFQTEITAITISVDIASRSCNGKQIYSKSKADVQALGRPIILYQT